MHGRVIPKSQCWLERWAEEERTLAKLHNWKLNTELNPAEGDPAHDSKRESKDSKDSIGSSMDCSKNSTYSIVDSRRPAATEASVGWPKASLYSFADPHNLDSFMGKIPRGYRILFGMSISFSILLGTLCSMITPFGSASVNATMLSGALHNFIYFFFITTLLTGLVTLWDFTAYMRTFMYLAIFYSISGVCAFVIEWLFGKSETNPDGISGVTILLIRLAIIFTTGNICVLPWMFIVVCGRNLKAMLRILVMVIVVNAHLFFLVVYQVTDTLLLATNPAIDPYRGLIFLVAKKIAYLMTSLSCAWVPYLHMNFTQSWSRVT